MDGQGEPVRLHHDDNSSPDARLTDQVQTESDNDADWGLASCDTEEDLSTSSLESSIRNYRVENGRTYHAYKDGKYEMPNDEMEQNRLDLQNHLFMLTMGGKLYQAPVKDLRNCLDVGTGTGIWAIDFAECHPDCKTIGIDLSPIQPSYVPPNLEFFVDDAEDSWEYHEEFDLIHTRMMGGAFRHWPSFISNAFSNLKPGGFLELQEIDGLGCDDDTFNPNPPSCLLADWWLNVCTAFAASGRKMDAAVDHYDTMKHIGFVDVEEKIIKWPLNSKWPKTKEEKEVGMWSMVNTLDVLEALTMAPFTRTLGWSQEAVQTLLVSVRRDVKDVNIHAYWKIRVIYGRKPIG